MSIQIVEELAARLGLEVDGEAYAIGEKLLGALRGGMVAAAAAAGALGLGVIAAAAKTAQYADQVEKAAQRTGIGVESLQALQYAAERADVSAGELEGALKFAAKRGVADLEGELRRAADEFAAMPDGAGKAARAVELFGRGGMALIPMLNKGSAGLDEMMQKARDMGLVMDEEAIASGAELKDTIEDLQGFLVGFTRTIAGPFLKPLREIVQRFNEWFKANRAIIAQRVELVARALGTAFKYAFQLIEPVVDILGRFFGWLLGSQMGRIAAVMAAVGLALAAPWAMPVIAILALLTALEELWGYFTGKRKTLLEDWLGPFNKIMETDPSDSAFTRGMKVVVGLLRDFAYYIGASAKAWDALLGSTVGKAGREFGKWSNLSDDQQKSIWDQVEREADANPEVNISNRADWMRRRRMELTSAFYAPGVPSHGGATVNIGAVNINAADGTDAADKFMQRVHQVLGTEYKATLPAAAR